MLARTYRLSGAQVKTTKSGRRSTNQLFSLITLPNFLNHARVAIIIGKKISPLAVVRNRLRRQIYDAMYPLVTKLSHDLIILPKPNTLSAAPHQLEASINQLINESTKPLN